MISREALKQTLNHNAINECFIADRDELNLLETFCVNARDAAIIGLLYDGVDGKNHEEILNLKNSDCNFEKNELLLTKNNGNTRVLTMPEDTMAIIREAIESKTYYRGNRRTEKDHIKISSIVNSDYVIRPISVEGSGIVMTPQLVNQRIRAIGKLFVYKKLRYLKPKSIMMSGFFNYLKERENELGREVTIGDCKDICDRFDLTMAKWYGQIEYYKTFKKYPWYIKSVGEYFNSKESFYAD
jgi:hypothetical protein